MADTDTTNGEKRDADGRFAKGGAPSPGRPKGVPNRATVDGRMLRARIFESWDRVNGDRILDELARTDPKAYIKLVVKLIPRDDA